jgi:DNA repair exonuclease SbcCD nuclease subunit
MSKILLFSDLHIHPHKKSLDRLEDCLKVLSWVAETAKKNSVKNIIFGGDFFHDRYKIDIYTYQRTFEVLRENFKGLKLWMLLGNHDLWFFDKSTVSSVTPFTAIDGIELIDKPKRIEIEGVNWDFLPFTNNVPDSLKTLNSLSGKKKYLIGHIAINDAKMHQGKYSSDILVEHEGDMVSVDPKLFSGYENVFLGHFHSKQNVNDNVEYIGSPLQLSFGEAFEKKCIVLLDVEDGTKKYIENKFSPKHIICKDDDLQNHDLNGNFVQLIVDDISNVDLLKIKKSITQENKVLELKVKQNKKIESKKDEEENIEASSYNEEDMISKYVEQSKTELDKEFLVKIGKKICEAQVL